MIASIDRLISQKVKLAWITLHFFLRTGLHVRGRCQAFGLAMMLHLTPEEVTANEAAGVKAKEDTRASMDAYDRAEFEKE